MNNKPFFSIVIPTYNRADLILETLDSVFDQTYDHYEILVVDNCSTDNTEELLKPLAAAERIRFIKHEKNYERARSRNTGMSEAKGDFLTFLDSDDFMYKNCLQDAAEFVNANPDCKFFHNLYELVDNDKKPIYQFQFPSLNHPYKALASGNFISCIGGFIHRDIYKKYRFSEDPKMIGSEDYEVWFEILAHHRLGRINKINSGIREHPNRSVNLGIYQNLQYQNEALVKKITNDPVLLHKFGPFLPRLRASFLLQQAIVLKGLGQKKKAILNALIALKNDKSILKTKRFYSVVYNSLK